MIKKYFGHVARAHEEAASAAKMAELLIDEIVEKSYMQLLSNRTWPLIMLEVPDMVKHAASVKMKREQQQKTEML